MWFQRKYYFVNLIFINYLIYFIDARKYRICIVDGHGIFKKAARYCPILDNTDSEVECIVGIDRYDCLRRISKGKADFAVFNSEDLLSALNRQVDLLITNKLQYTDDLYEYEVVAVVNRNSNISNVYDTKNKRFCHPGYGTNAEWDKVLSNFFEARVVPSQCDPNLSLVENRIKASSNYFQSMCKAGPWLSEKKIDQVLKWKYSNMCALCDNPSRCLMNDKYWGRRGVLFCLTDGVGDISWARLDDVQSHFGLKPGAKASDINVDDYFFLCQNGQMMPINTYRPCVWVAKPWPVVVSKRESATKIQSFISALNYTDNSTWKEALLNLVETVQSYQITNMDPIVSIDTFLEQVPGYLSANSFSGCHPPRTVRMCTTSNVENAKCNWLREAAAVNGIEPDIDCSTAANKTLCFKGINNKYVDLTMVNPNQQFLAVKEYNLKTLFYEATSTDDLYTTVAVVKRESNIRTLADLKNKMACFPIMNGIAYNTILYHLKHNKLLDTTKCPYENAMANYFSFSCIPKLHNGNSRLQQLCDGDLYDNENGAFRCLASGHADVAFIDLKTFRKYTDGMSEESWAQNLKSNDFSILCINNTYNCGLSVMAYSQGMVNKNISVMQQHEMFNTMMQIDSFFGSNQKERTPAFQLYGTYDEQSNILFNDNTIKFHSDMIYQHNIDNLPISYNDIITDLLICQSNPNGVTHAQYNIYYLLLCLVFIQFFV